MKKTILVLFVVLLMVSLSARDFASDLHITQDEQRHGLGVETVNFLTLVVTEKPVISAGVGTLANTLVEVYDYSQTKHWNKDDFNTGLVLFPANCLINFGLIEIKNLLSGQKSTATANNTRRYDIRQSTVFDCRDGFKITDFDNIKEDLSNFGQSNDKSSNGPRPMNPNNNSDNSDNQSTKNRRGNNE